MKASHCRVLPEVKTAPPSVQNPDCRVDVREIKIRPNFQSLYRTIEVIKPRITDVGIAICRMRGFIVFPQGLEMNLRDVTCCVYTPFVEYPSPPDLLVLIMQPRRLVKSAL